MEIIKLNKKILLEKFEEINTVLIDLDFNMEFVVVGGSAFILKNYIDRATMDIDLINKVDKGILDIITSSTEIDINNRVSVKSFERIFKGWENEVEDFMDYSNLSVKILSDEMLVATKFFTKVMDRDISEMAYSGNIVDKEKLELIVEGILNRTNSVEKSWMIDRELEIIEFYKALGWSWDGSYIKKLLR